MKFIKVNSKRICLDHIALYFGKEYKKIIIQFNSDNKIEIIFDTKVDMKAEEFKACPECGGSDFIWYYNNDHYKCNECRHSWKYPNLK